MEDVNQQKKNRFKAVIRLSFQSISAAFLLSLIACSPVYKSPDLGGLYNSLVQNESPYRNPVVLIPGLLGSKLVNKRTGKVVWGAFGLDTVSPRTAEGARTIAIPMLYNFHIFMVESGTSNYLVFFSTLQDVHQIILSVCPLRFGCKMFLLERFILSDLCVRYSCSKRLYFN